MWAASDGVPDLVPDLFASGLEDNLAAPEIVVFKVEPRCDGGTRLAVTGSACPHHTVVSAEGIVDRQSRAELRDALLTTISTGREGMIGGRREGLVAVDLLRAVFADDWGWATLAEIHMRLSGQGRRLFVILDPHGDAHRHMERLGLDTLLSPLDSRRALNRLG